MSHADRTASALTHYLAHYAEPAAAAHAATVSATYQQALVVPAYDENPAFIEPHLARARRAQALIIVVVNAPDNAPADARQRTLDLLRTLQNRNEAGLLCIDAATTPVPKRQGVGFARKLGTDVAALLWQSGKLEVPWIYQTDADATLPTDYFAAQHLPDRGAIIFGYRHVSHDPLVQQAAWLYEAHMDFYVRGLARAGSPYAWPTLGSTLAVHALDYARVRGYPRRNAGEDFYLLNKLAKTCPITHRPNVRITLAARLSHRVPFGTGPALARAIESLRACPDGSAYLSYHPSSFELLARAIQALHAFAQDDAAPTLAGRPGELLELLGFDRVAAKFARQHAPGAHRQVAVDGWFDGFRSLRFVHEARRWYPDQPLLESLWRSVSPQ